jgi:hypothetical protein
MALGVKVKVIEGCYTGVVLRCILGIAPFTVCLYGRNKARQQHEREDKFFHKHLVIKQLFDLKRFKTTIE